MAALPYMKLYPGDYFGDTGHLSCLEHGIYLQLILRYFIRGGSLPDDDEFLARLVGLGPREWKRCRPRVISFFQITGGAWLHQRIESEIALATDKSLKSRHAARASVERRLNGRSTPVERPLTYRATPESESESPSSIDIELGRAGAREPSNGKKFTKPKAKHEFAGEETIMRGVREAFDSSLPAGEYAVLFCDPRREITFVSEEGRLVAYCADGFTHSLVRDHEFRLSQVAQSHGFKEAWIREQPPEGDRP